MKRRCFFDLDGVIVNFDAYYKFLIGYNFDIYCAEEEKELKWKLLDSHPTFFEDMPLMEGALEMWEAAKPFRRGILSAATRRIPTCEEQKRISVKKHLLIDDPNDVIIVHRKRDKVLHCEPRAILVDDLARNIEEWEKSGGIGILYKNSEQVIEDLKKYY